MERKLPEGTDPRKWKKKRPEIILGRDYDGTVSKLPPYVDIDGVQVHPSRVKRYLERRKKLGNGKKS